MKFVDLKKIEADILVAEIKDWKENKKLSYYDMVSTLVARGFTKINGKPIKARDICQFMIENGFRIYDFRKRKSSKKKRGALNQDSFKIPEPSNIPKPSITSDHDMLKIIRSNLDPELKMKLIKMGL